MSGDELDVRDRPPAERHERIHEAFAALAPGETLAVVTDHEPTPLFHEFRAAVDAFDPDGYELQRRGPEEFVARFPKSTDGDTSTADPSAGPSG